jgi:hypothetical protein
MTSLNALPPGCAVSDADRILRTASSDTGDEDLGPTLRRETPASTPCRLRVCEQADLRND